MEIFLLTSRTRVVMRLSLPDTLCKPCSLWLLFLDQTIMLTLPYPIKGNSEDSTNISIISFLI